MDVRDQQNHKHATNAQDVPLPAAVSDDAAASGSALRAAADNGTASVSSVRQKIVILHGVPKGLASESRLGPEPGNPCVCVCV